MNRRLKLAGLFLAALLVACAAPQGPTLSLDEEARAALAASGDAPTASARIRADLAYLADDGRQGRDTGSKGYLEAANYVAARFKAMGLAPGADGGWFQTVRFIAARRDLDAAEMTLAWPDGEKRTLVHLEDYLIGRPMTAPAFDVTAPLVFAGYGVVDAESGRDDYAGVDARGKIAVVFKGAPESYDSEERAFFSSTANKRAEAAAKGAVGLILVDTKSSQERRPWARLIANPTKPAMAWIGPDGAPKAGLGEALATAEMSPQGAALLFSGARRGFAALQDMAAEGAKTPAFELAASATLKGASTFERLSSPNVVAKIDGADPRLKDEVLVLTAHLDHLGVRAPKEKGGDGIYNGALDNALGVATILDVAGAFSQGARPRRTVYFVAVTAEEKGLIGSDYFAHFPTTAGRRIVAEVNLDMPVLLYPFTDVIAFGADHSTLGETVREAAATMGVALSPDPLPEESIFVRSDHYRFVQQDIPSVYLFPGFANGGEAAVRDFLKNRYHQPSDDLSQPIDYDAAARFAALNYAIARRIADDAAAPRWNDGDFFGDIFAQKDGAFAAAAQ